MYTVCALYHFTPFADHTALRTPLLDLAKSKGVTGTLLLAHEGINGTIAGSREGIDAMLAHIRALPGCADLEWKESTASEQPFARMKVKLKKEIVTMGQPDLDPLAGVGTYVAPDDWNTLISNPETILIDTRNDYEVQIGTFKGAIDPETAQDIAIAADQKGCYTPTHSEYVKNMGNLSSNLPVKSALNRS